MNITPKQQIRSARQKAQKALIECCADKIAEISTAFRIETGLPVESIEFEFVEVNTFGESNIKTVLSGVRIRHNNA